MDANAQPYYTTSGTMRVDAPSYIERNADAELLAALENSEFCYVLDTRQIGKSSLMVRTADKLRKASVRAEILDLTSGGNSVSVEQWYYGLLITLAKNTGLLVECRAFWQANKDIGPLQRWLEAVRTVILPAAPAPLVLFIDEIDAVLNLPFSTDEFFAGIRECYNRRAEDPALNRLTFCLLGTTTPDNLVRDVRTTPFNIGRRIVPTDFTANEAAPLADGMNSEGRDGAKLLTRILYWTNGHPYLTQRVCAAVAADSSVRDAKGVDRIVERCFFVREASEGDHLKFVAKCLLESEAGKRDVAGLLELYERVRSRKGHVMHDPADQLCTALLLSGAVRVVEGYLWIRNRVYFQAFDRAWINANMPDAELQRQRAAVRRGHLQIGALAGSIVTVMTGLAAFGFIQASRANKNAERAETEQNHARKEAIAARTAEAKAKRNGEEATRLLYFADMNLIPAAWEKNNIGRINDLLEETKENPNRGFEWGYWHRLCHLNLLTLAGHKDFVACVAFSPDGKKIVTGSNGNTVKVCDATTGGNLFTLVAGSATDNEIEQDLTIGTRASFSYDGRRIVTGGADEKNDLSGIVKVWDVDTGRELLTLKLKERSFQFASVAFSPDGKRIMAKATGNSEVKVWNATNGNELFTLKDDKKAITCAAFSPDSKQIATASDSSTLKSRNDNKVKIWDTATGKELLTIRGHSGEVNSIAFSPDGNRIITGNTHGVVMSWDTKTGRELYSLNLANDVSPLALSPDSNRIATNNASDQTAQICDIQTGNELSVFRDSVNIVPFGPHLFVAYSPDGKRIMTAGNDGTAKVWDATINPESIKVKEFAPDFKVNSIVYSPDRKRTIRGSTDNTVKLCDAKTGMALCTLKGHTDAINAVAFSSDGKRILTGSKDSTAKLWDAESGRELLTMARGDAEIVTVGFSVNGKGIFTRDKNGTGRFWLSE